MRRLGPVLPMAAAAMLLAWMLFVGFEIGPATSTETRYAEMGREMQASGDWLIPTLNGAPLVEKPPFEAWATAAACAVAGVNDVAPRLPSLLAAFGVLGLVLWVGRRFAPADDEAPRERGRLAVLALATMPAFLIQAYVISTDIWLVLTTTAAGLALLECERARGRPRIGWVLLLHGAMGVGMLVKGPLTLGLTLGVAVISAALRRDARPLRAFIHPLGLLLFLLLVAPWYLAAEHRIPGLLGTLIDRRLFGGLASSADFHHHSVWVVWLPLLGTFPWLGALPASIAALRRRGAWLDGPGLTILLLALAAPLLFTFSASRLVSYASPAFPWIALLAALGAPLRRGETDGSWGRAVSRSGTAVALFAVASGIGLLAAESWSPLAVAVVVAAGLCSAFLLVCPSILGACRNPALRAAMIAAVLVVLGGTVTMAHPERLDAGRPLWDSVVRLRGPGEELGAALPATGDWGLLPWYSRGEARFFGYPSAIHVLTPETFERDRFLPVAALVPWFTTSERRWLLIDARDRERLLPGVAVWQVIRSGRYEVLTNRPLPGGA